MSNYRPTARHCDRCITSIEKQSQKKIQQLLSYNINLHSVIKQLESNTALNWTEISGITLQHTTLCFKKNCTLFIFAITLSILGWFAQFLAVIHLRKIAIKPILYFPPHLFSAPLLYLLRQASYLTDIHSDEHRNRIVKSGKSRQKTLTKHAKTSQDSQSKFSKCRPLAFTQVRSCTCHWSIAWSITDCCIPDHAAIRRCFRSSALRISVWYTQSCMIPQTL